MNYQANGKQYDTNSKTNNGIMEHLLKEQVYDLASVEESEKLNASLHGERRKSCDECGSNQPFKKVNDTTYMCSACGKIFSKDEYDTLISEEVVVFQWFVVCSELAKQLKANGAIVRKYGNRFFWGRESYGQALSMDLIIAKCMMDWKILDGMENCPVGK